MSRNLRVSSNSDVHPFAGCNQLLRQYQMTGAALLDYERSSSSFLPPLILPSRRVLAQFSAGVSFVPVEVLESYLEDLLDLGVKDQSLFIERASSRSRALTIAGCVVILGLIGVFTVSAEPLMPQLLTTLVITSILVVGATLLLLRPKVLRRFAFAQLLSQEISSRRGTTRPFRPALTSELSVSG